MTLDDLITMARLTAKEAVILDELMKHDEVNTEQLAEAVRASLKKNKYRGKDKKNYAKRNARAAIHALNSKLVQADIGYAIIKTSGIGRGIIGTYRLRRPDPEQKPLGQAAA